MSQESIELRQMLLGMKPYLVIELNVDETVNLNAHGGTKREYVKMMKAATRAIRRSKS
jgi:hypothetical protein